MTALQISHALGDRLTVATRSGQPLATYHYASGLQRPYLHPLAPPGAPPLTLCAPHDHPWHHGLFLAWKFVDGTDFWQSGAGHVVSGDVQLTEHTAEIVRWQHDAAWLRDGSPDGEVLLRETRSLSIRLLDAASTLVTWTSSFGADRRVELASDERQYGGIGIRLIRDFQLRPRLLRRGHESSGPEGIRGESSPWSAWYGRYDATGEWGGVVLVDHPANPRHPAPVFVPKSLPEMAFLMSGFTYGGPYTIEPGEPLTLRYGIVATSGDPEMEHDTLQAAYVEHLATMEQR